MATESRTRCLVCQMWILFFCVRVWIVNLVDFMIMDNIPILIHFRWGWSHFRFIKRKHGSRLYISAPHECWNNNCVRFSVFDSLLGGFSVLADECELPGHSAMMLKVKERLYFVKEGSHLKYMRKIVTQRWCSDSFLSFIKCKTILLGFTEQLECIKNSQREFWYLEW